MRTRFEFALHTVRGGHVDPELALCGEQGWEIRGITAFADGAVVVALQRPIDEETLLPQPETLAASLEAPLSVPAPAEVMPGG